MTMPARQSPRSIAATISRVGVDVVDDGEIERRLEVLEQVLAELAAFAVEGADRKVLEVEIDAVAEQKHLRERQQQRDHQAARIAPDLQHLLHRNGLEPAQPHAACLRLAISTAMSCTKTSSSEGWMRSSRARPQRLLGQISRQLGEAALGVADEDVDGIAEDGSIEHSRRLLQRRQRRSEHFAFEQEKLAAERRALEFVRTADGDDPALIDQGGAMAIFGLVHVMGRDQHGDAVGGERVDEIPEPPPRCRLDARGRLVEKQDRRPMQHRAAERQPLLPAAGERRNQRLLAAAEPGHVDCEPHPLGKLAARGTR